MTIKLAWTRDKNTGSHVLRATQWDGTFTDHVYIVLHSGFLTHLTDQIMQI